MSDLFSHQGEIHRRALAPLADRLRPRSLEEFVGQAEILGPGRLLRRAIRADRVGNLILHGPPGVGKTTLARIIASSTRAHFTSLNAVLAGVKDLRVEVEAARQRLERHGLRTLLFIDEVHRFNVAQQDALLPWVENGTVTLIGATTENPYFEVNKALVSRSRLFRLQPLEPRDLRVLLERALADGERGYGGRPVELTPEAADHLLDVAGGDARSLLNALELAVESSAADASGVIRIDLEIAEQSIQQRAVLYDKQGDAHFDTISAFIKSLRGSDPDAALFWLARMVEAGENPRFIFRRMLISAGEDIGLADPQAMVVVEACAAAFERVGLPEGLYPLAQAALYLAGAEKSNSLLGFFDALKSVRATNRQEVPSHLRDANRDGAAFGDGVGYRYPHAYAEHWVAQTYLPAALQGEVFWLPGRLGWEGGLQGRLQRRRAALLAAAAESAADSGPLLSSGPDDAELERWLQRQAAAEGERLDQLRQRFWQGANWRRQDRTLILAARSLLWALDPLENCPEGGVLITVDTAADQERLQAQCQLLDSLRSPRLQPLDPTRPGNLSKAMEPGERFEWLVGRSPFQGLAPELWQRWLKELDQLASPRAQWRLLLSGPLLGPAGALAELLARPGASETALADKTLLELLQRVSFEEDTWLTAQPTPTELTGALEAMNWQVEQESWQESLTLDLNESAYQRWFSPGAAYRNRLETVLNPVEIATVEAGFRGQLRGQLPQRLLHHRLIAHRR
ncbi:MULTISPECIES: AAA family ATPase [unclassified Synechococcus]|uniref:AAA family ATPase n=1 Tax=unclassified Synechococcus TaxID=2626047 RepID=UPI0000699379|nr:MULTISPECIES: AAA family ATPase [unclassified Synechococcus]EAQ76316.1 ATPase [Synechococcus sp. WH 5701]WFN59000.1 AAA family ATPase [Synechococcus sp. CCFWC 502]